MTFFVINGIITTKRQGLRIITYEKNQLLDIQCAYYCRRIKATKYLLRVYFFKIFVPVVMLISLLYKMSCNKNLSMSLFNEVLTKTF